MPHSSAAVLDEELVNGPDTKTRLTMSKGRSFPRPLILDVCSLPDWPVIIDAG